MAVPPSQLPIPGLSRTCSGASLALLVHQLAAPILFRIICKSNKSLLPPNPEGRFATIWDEQSSTLQGMQSAFPFQILILWHLENWYFSEPLYLHFLASWQMQRCLIITWQDAVGITGYKSVNSVVTLLRGGSVTQGAQLPELRPAQLYFSLCLS